MAINDPIAIYNAETNLDAFLAQRFLESHGVEAFAVEDNSLAGYWWGGTLPGIHKPQVWVNSQNKERAAQLLVEYDQLRRTRDAARTAHDSELISIRCDRCGTVSQFAKSLVGTVQDCPHCGSYLDVEAVDSPLDGDESGGEESAGVAPSPSSIVESANVATDDARPTLPMSRQLLWMELFAVLCLGVLPDLVISVSRFLGTTDLYRSFAWDQIILIAFSLQITVPTLYIIFRSAESLGKFGLVRPRIADVFIGVSLFAAAWFTMLLAVAFVPTWFVPVLDGLEPGTPAFFEKPSSAAGLVLLLVATIANAICEELVMRAYLITRLCQLGLTSVGAVLVSSALFASYHLYAGVWAVYQLFFVALVFGLAFLWVRRIWPLILAHAIYGVLAAL